MPIVLFGLVNVCVHLESTHSRSQSTHPLIEPVQIFDNLYAIGRSSTIVYAITASDGIILIDSGYGDQIDSVLLPGMAQLGLDPADVELVFLAHGHGDQLKWDE